MPPSSTPAEHLGRADLLAGTGTSGHIVRRCASGGLRMLTRRPAKLTNPASVPWRSDTGAASCLPFGAHAAVTWTFHHLLHPLRAGADRESEQLLAMSAATPPVSLVLVDPDWDASRDQERPSPGLYVGRGDPAAAGRVRTDRLLARFVAARSN
jgi:hypothetical protein